MAKNRNKFIKNVGKSTVYGLKSYVVKPALEDAFTLMEDINKEYMEIREGVEGKINSFVKDMKNSEQSDFKKSIELLKKDLKDGHIFGSEETRNRMEMDALEKLGAGEEMTEAIDWLTELNDGDDDDDVSNLFIDPKSEKKPKSNVIKNDFIKNDNTKTINMDIRSEANPIDRNLKITGLQLNRDLNQRVINTLSVVSSQIKGIHEFHIENTVNFYEESTRFYSDLMERMDKFIIYSSSNFMSPLHDDNPFSSDGSFDVSKYMEKIGIKELLRDKSDEDDELNLFKSALKDPLGTISSLALPSLLSRESNRLLEEINETFRELPLTLNNYLLDLANSNVFGINKIARFLSVENRGYDSSKARSKYNKGPIPFDGVTKKSITDIIPGYLSRILNVISGGKQDLITDYRSGQLVDRSLVEEYKEFENKKLSKNSMKKSKTYVKNLVGDNPELLKDVNGLLEFISDNNASHITKFGQESISELIGKGYNEELVNMVAKSINEDDVFRNRLNKDIFTRGRALESRDMEYMDELNPILSLDDKRNRSYVSEVDKLIYASEDKFKKTEDRIKGKAVGKVPLLGQANRVLESGLSKFLNRFEEILANPVKGFKNIITSIWDSFTTSSIGAFFLGDKYKLEKDTNEKLSGLYQKGVVEENSIAVKDNRLYNKLDDQHKDTKEFQEGLIPKFNRKIKEFIIGEDDIQSDKSLASVIVDKTVLSTDRMVRKLFKMEDDDTFKGLFNDKIMNPFKNFIAGDDLEIGEDGLFGLMSRRMETSVITPMKNKLIGEDIDSFKEDQGLFKTMLRRVNMSIIKPARDILFGPGKEYNLIDNFLDPETRKGFLKYAPGAMKGGFIGLLTGHPLLGITMGMAMKTDQAQKILFDPETGAVNKLKEFMIGDNDKLSKEDTFVKIAINQFKDHIIEPANKALFGEGGLQDRIKNFFHKEDGPYKKLLEERVKPFTKNLLKPFLYEAKWQAKRLGKFALKQTARLTKSLGNFLGKFVKDTVTKSPFFKKLSDTGNKLLNMAGRVIKAPFKFLRKTADNLMDTQLSRVESGEAAKSDFKYLYNKDELTGPEAHLSRTNDEISSHTKDISDDLTRIISILTGKGDPGSLRTSTVKGGGKSADEVIKEQQEISKENAEKGFREDVIDNMGTIAQNTNGLGKLANFFKKAFGIGAAIFKVGKSFFTKTKLGKFIAGKGKDTIEFLKDTKIYKSLAEKTNKLFDIGKESFIKFKDLGLQKIEAFKPIIAEGMVKFSTMASKAVQGGMGIFKSALANPATLPLLAGAGLGLHDRAKGKARGESGLQLLGSTLVGNAGETFGSSMKNAIKQAAKYGSVGFGLGTVFPVVGNIMGGLAGAGIGFVSGLFGSDPRQGMDNLKSGFKTVGTGIKNIGKAIFKPIKGLANLILKPFKFIGEIILGNIKRTKDIITGIFTKSAKVLNMIPFVNIKIPGADKEKNELETAFETAEVNERPSLLKRMTNGLFGSQVAHAAEMDSVDELIRIKKQESADIVNNQRLYIKDMKTREADRQEGTRKILDKWDKRVEKEEVKKEEEKKERRGLIGALTGMMGGMFGSLSSGLSNLFGGGSSGGGLFGRKSSGGSGGGGGITFTGNASDVTKLATKYETGNSGPGAIARNAGDYGGASYGKYQYSKNMGSLKTFVDHLKNVNPQMHEQLMGGGVQLASSEFDRRWKNLAKTNEAEFGKIQDDFTLNQYFNPMANRIKKDTGLDVTSRSKALQAAIFSTSVQHGMGSKIPSNVIKALGADADDEAIIKGIYEERGAGNGSKHFRSSSRKIQQSVANRFKRESKDALDMLAQERSSGGSNVGMAQKPTSNTGPREFDRPDMGAPKNGGPTVGSTNADSSVRSGGMINNFPYYNQTEEPWASLPYNGKNIKASGCGPTSMAMVLSSFGVKTDPKQMGEYATAKNHAIRGVGTAHAFFKDVGSQYGINTTNANFDQAYQALAQGKPVIASMKPPTFTKGGHFIVLSGLDKQGRILVNDSASVKRSKAWDPNVIKREHSALFIFDKDGQGSIDSTGMVPGSADMSGGGLFSGGSSGGLFGGGIFGRQQETSQVDVSGILKSMTGANNASAIYNPESSSYLSSGSSSTSSLSDVARISDNSRSDNEAIPVASLKQENLLDEVIEETVREDKNNEVRRIESNNNLLGLVKEAVSHLLDIRDTNRTIAEKELVVKAENIESSDLEDTSNLTDDEIRNRIVSPELMSLQSVINGDKGGKDYSGFLRPSTVRIARGD